MRKILVTTSKGGSGKSTTAALTGINLAGWTSPNPKRMGEPRRVLLIDADTKSQGLSDWFTLVALRHGGTHGLHIECAPWTHQAGLLVPFVQGQIDRLGGPDMVDEVIIDTGGEDPENSKHAARLCDLAILPIAPTPAEMRRAEATRTVLDGTGIAFGVLLTRVDDPGKGRALAARQALEGHKNPFYVFQTEIPNNRTIYADPWGSIPTSVGKYADLTVELEKVEL